LIFAIGLVQRIGRKDRPGGLSHRLVESIFRMPPRSAKRPAPPVPAVREPVAPIIAPPWLRPIVIALAAALLFIWFSPEVADSDTWWHLKTGQYILQTHKLPVPDPFAFTTATAGSAYPDEATVRHFNLTHEWLAQIIFYLVYAAGGFPGIVVFRSLLLMGVCALAGAVAWRRSNRFYLAVGAAVATGLIGDRYVSDRPFLISFLLFAATIALLEYRRWLWALPAMFLFWANCHGGFFLGWALVGAYCVEAAVARYRGHAQDGDKRLYLIGAIAIAVSGLNPNFFEAVEMPLLYRESMLQGMLLEWRHTALWPLEPFPALLFAAIIVMVLAWRRVRLVDWMLFLAFAFGAVWAVRNVMLFGIVAPFLIAAYFPWKRALPAIAEFAAAALLILGIGLGVASGTGLQFRASVWKYPWGAAKFLEEHHIRSRMLNSYDHGGFLIWRLWPQEQVFIDGRALSDTVFKDFRNIVYNMAGSDPRQLLDKYGIETIVLDGFEYLSSGEPFRLVPVLGLSTPVEWHLVYWDDTATIFMRHPPPGVTPLQNAYAMNSIEAQCESYVAHDPYHPRCARGLSTLYMQLSDNARARKWMDFYLQHAVDPDPEARAIYARLLTSGR
jgi:hypothetical protein